MNVSRTYYGNHFPIHVNQISKLYTLNLQGDICQLFLNKPEENAKKMPYDYHQYQLTVTVHNESHGPELSFLFPVDKWILLMSFQNFRLKVASVPVSLTHNLQNLPQR